MMRIGQSLGRSHALRQGGSADLPAKQQGQGNRGFSLIEMLVVIGIIGIVAAIAIPNFASWRERQAVNSAANSLLSHMKQARAVAMAENRSVKITFAGDNYTYDADTAGNCGLCKPQIVPFSDFSSNLKITKSDQALVAETQTFSSRGTTGNNTIYFCSNGFTNRIVVNIIGRSYRCESGDTSTACTSAYTCT